MTHESPVKQRLNITFGKFGALKYTGAIDIAKVWERVLRRANLPILYTEGFNTRPRIQLAATLPMGITSECEILDVSLREILPTLDGVREHLELVSPDGLKIYKVEAVPVRAPTLPRLVRSAKYRIRIEDPIGGDDLPTRINRLLSQERVLKVIEGKKRRSVIDLRPMILDLQVDDSGDLIAHLSAGERGNLQPDDVLRELGLDGLYVTCHRYRLHLDEYYDRLMEKEDAWS